MCPQPVLHVIYSMDRGGAETLLLESVRSNPASHADGGFPAKIICWHHEGELADQIRATGISVEVLGRKSRPLWQIPLILNDLRLLIRAVAESAESHGAQIIHGHLVDGAFIAVLAASSARAKAVATIYSNHVIPMSLRPGTLKRWIWERVTRYSFRRLDRVISISDDVTETLVKEFAAPPDRIAVIPVSVAEMRPVIDRDTARGMFNIPQDCFCMVTVGRLAPNKQHKALISAVGLLRDAGRDVHLLIAGRGPEQDALSQQISELGLDGHVTLLGPYPDLSEPTVAADLFVTASLSEGVSLALLEAMSAHRPILSTACEGNRDLLADGRGHLVSEGDVQAIADGIATLIDNPELREKYALTAFPYYRDNYSQEASFAAQAATYAAVLEDTST
ncbi:glycosyltransferase [Litoreibacter janthinus]|uniref:Glycosyltransferase involved in cell wall bisynthesis n=1 Tax=Litoreibacter janthinus TaxID=670154 RepID=A0A1I6FUS6_9RHOB|nr:glycosyltransferase [Litoreibacter janthinus]SFR33702.1 Glycosyltransferase involved in cell wall bisynthesis [Litoreibacter janthinus]